MKRHSIIYGDLESLIKKVVECNDNNKLSTIKVGEHILSGL